MNFGVNIVYPNKKHHSNGYKLLVKLLKTLHILLAIDLGVYRDKPFKCRLFLYVILVINCLFVIVIGIWESFILKSFANDFWSILHHLEYSIVILLLSNIKRDTTFISLLRQLESIDAKLQVDFCSYHTELKFVFLLCSNFIWRIFVSGLYGFVSSIPYSFNYFLKLFSYMFLSYCVDIFMVSYAYMYYLLYLRFAKLTLIIETSDDVRFMLSLYKTIVDKVLEYKHAYDTLFIVVLLGNVPHIMGTIYYTLQQFQKVHSDQVFLIALGIEYINVAQVLAVTIAPAFVADMLAAEAEKIKKTLHNRQLLQEVGDGVQLGRFIEYVEARPCRLRVWRLVPLSADLLGMVLGFCATYLIVIIQFTHLKE